MTFFCRRNILYTGSHKEGEKGSHEKYVEKCFFFMHQIKATLVVSLEKTMANLDRTVSLSCLLYTSPSPRD